MRFIPFPMRIIPCLILAGCAATQKMQDTLDTEAQAMHQRRTEAFEKKDKASAAALDGVIEKIPGVWLGSSTSSDSGRSLPASTGEFVYSFGDRVGMSAIAERITLITGIPVRLAPDVFMSMQTLLASAGQPSATAVPTAQGVAAPAPNPAMTSPYGVGAAAATGGYDALFKGPYRGSLAGFLDLVCARGLHWQYRDNTLYISRLMTKVFAYRAPTVTSSKSNVSVGRSGNINATSGNANGGGNAGSTSYDGTVKTSADTEMSPWSSLGKDIDAVKSPVGHYSISKESNSVVVTDLPEIVEKIGAIIDRRNQAARKQVRVILEIINAITSSDHEFGLDWSLINQRLVSVAPEWSLSFTSPASLVSSSVATLAYTVMNGQGGAANPRSMSGSSALLKAMNQVGQATALMRTQRMAPNNQPTSFALTDQGSYICNTTPAASSIGGTTGGTPGITQCTYTVGYTLTLTPTVLDNGRISIQGSFDFSELKKVAEAVSAGQLVQQPLITDLADMLQASEVKSGETLVMTALEKRTGSYDKRGLGEGGSIGSFSGSSAVQSIVILLTPVVVED